MINYFISDEFNYKITKFFKKKLIKYGYLQSDLLLLLFFGRPSKKEKKPADL